ncbi:MAG TPA: flagellar biosynthesis anti-sigma factor FlgM, partial [Leptolinea sp.]
KVQNNQINPLIAQKTESTHQVSKPTRLDEPVGGAGTDRAELSERAKLLSKASQTFQDTPEVRSDRVNDIKVQVDTGTYQIPLSELARRLFKKVV